MDAERIAWLEKRRDGIGASDAVILLAGPQYGKTAADVLASKLGPVVEMESDDIRRGHLYEDLAIEAWIDQHPHYSLRDGQCSQLLRFWSYGRAHASLDALVHGVVGGIQRLGVLEVKSPRSQGARDTEADGPRPQWIMQCQYQMAVVSHIMRQNTGGPFWSQLQFGQIVVWHPEEARIHTHEVPWGDEEQAQSRQWVEYCQDWYQRHVIAGEPLPETPPPVPLPQHELDVDLTNTTEGQAVEWYCAAKERLKAAEQEVEIASAALSEVAAAHQARRLISGDTRITRIVNAGRRTTDIKNAMAANPQIDWAKYERIGSEYVVWRVSKR